MIKITTIKNIKPDDFDETWVIMRSLKKPIKNTEQVIDLSPSKILLSTAMKLKRDDEWGKETFDSIYVPNFLNEIKRNLEAKKLLNYLYTQDKADKNICFTCFCVDETLCHRSIIAGLLQGVGCNVELDTNNDYSHYYTKWREL